jgi:hypothetical protein
LSFPCLSYDSCLPCLLQSSEPRPEAAPYMDDKTIKRNKQIAVDAKKLSRYVTKIEDVVHNHLLGPSDELDDHYPYIRAPPAKGATPVFAADKLSTAVALHGAHGEVVNTVTAQVLANSTVGDKKVAGKRGKKSKFADSDTPSSGGAASSNGQQKQEDIVTKYLEPRRPRAYEGGRIIVFVVGGITLMEMAALERISKETNREIIYGGTSIITATDLLDQLYEIEPALEEDDIRTGKSGAGGGKGGAAGAFALPDVDDVG